MYKAYFDGACSGNPGMMTIRFVVYDPEGQTVGRFSKEIGHGTNNMAEYHALIALLKHLSAVNIEEILIMGDSQLVVNQVMKKWKINHQHIHKLAVQAWALMKDWPEWELIWIPRDRNRAHGAD